MSSTSGSNSDPPHQSTISIELTLIFKLFKNNRIMCNINTWWDVHLHWKHR